MTVPPGACCLQVQTTTERLIVFLLSRVVDGSAQEEALFSPHPCTERCKLLWSGGQAVGFYTVKHKGATEGRRAEEEVDTPFLYVNLTSLSSSISSSS